MLHNIIPIQPDLATNLYRYKLRVQRDITLMRPHIFHKGFVCYKQPSIPSPQLMDLNHRRASLKTCLLILRTQFLHTGSNLEVDIQVVTGIQTEKLTKEKRKKITIISRHKVTDKCITYCKIIFKQKKYI